MRGVLAALLLLSAPAARAAKGGPTFIPPSRSFTCELPGEAWTAFEEEGPRGLSTHILGPEEPDGAFRPALHVHVFDRGRPGFVSWQELLPKLRARDPELGRESTSMVSWRVDGKPARTFEVKEERLLPLDRYPAEWVTLHHFYALIPGAGDNYLLVKLSSTEKSYLNYRETFKRFLRGFKL